MANILEGAIGAVVGVFILVVFVEILQVFTWNSELTNISSGAIGLLNIIDLVLAASILIGIVVMGFSLRQS